MTMPVTTTPEGTMPGTEGTKPPEVKGKIPEGGKEVSAEDKLYTQRQLDAFIHAAKSEIGRNVKDLERERNDLKSQLQTKTSEVEDIKSERESIQQQIEDLSSEDPKKFDLIKRDKELRDRERKARERERDIEAKERVNAERIARADAFEVELLCESIADEYEGGNSMMLHNICKATGVKTEEAIHNLADTLWSKTPEPVKEPLKTYSGYTGGGGKESFEDLMKVNVKNLTYQEKLAHQKKLNEARKSLIR